MGKFQKVKFLKYLSQLDFEKNIVENPTNNAFMGIFENASLFLKIKPFENFLLYGIQDSS